MAELAVPVWEPGLTISESHQIECCQKVACAVILGLSIHKSSYRKSLKTLGLKSLKSRRTEICENYAKKSLNNSKFRTWFSINEDGRQHNTRSKKTFLKPFTTRTMRYERSPLPFLTSMLNNKINTYDEIKSQFTFS